MSASPLPQQAGTLRLPDSISLSRTEDLEALFAACAGQASVEIDASQVRNIDSRGFEYLMNGFEQLNLDGTRVLLFTPSSPLITAMQCLRLDDRLPIRSEDRPPVLSELPLDLGAAILESGLLDAHTVDTLRESAHERGIGLRHLLLEHERVGPERLAEVNARQHDMPMVRPVRDRLLDVTIDHQIPLRDLRTHGVLPFLQLEDKLAVAVADPSNVFAIDVVRQATGLKVVPAVTTEAEIQSGLDLIQRSAGKADASATLVEDGRGAAERLDATLLNALIEGASDIHIEPCEGHHLLRFRVDGRLREVERLNPEQGSSLVARIKVMADCDISEKRLPQDGRIHFQHGTRDVDLRVNTLPTVHGEKAVMRILDRTQQSPKLDSFGFAKHDLQALRDSIHAPHGMVLVTGPTGSGKTTTLYSVLAEVVSPEINVATVENPVERSLDGVNQTQVNQKAGLNFGLCLRALLRQDPDVIMIGEIRDHETAEIAVEASLTGHLVLATLHTNDAPSAATRLIQMGIEPFLVSATLRMVMAQRLVRALCPSCKTRVELPGEVCEQYAGNGLKPGTSYAASGCPACRGTGYSGRRGVFEVMAVDSEMRDLIARNPSSDEARELALQHGMTSLLADGIRRVNEGVTTLEEAIRCGGTA
ncbi:MAG: type II secretion system protein GspE [Planctomycetes bacterium]|nr:type II secretion system protein GspE [Planctomycetota bacterium]